MFDSIREDFIQLVVKRLMSSTYCIDKVSKETVRELLLAEMAVTEAIPISASRSLSAAVELLEWELKK
jgi:hypothetical protein